jgi:hypothetical protein
VIPQAKRNVAHIDTLEKILHNWQGTSKYASWRLVETIASDDCNVETRAKAAKVVIQALKNKDVATYAKYRMLHHLFRKRSPEKASNTTCYFDRLTKTDQDAIKLVLLPSLVGEPAFELNIIAIYAMKSVGMTGSEISRIVSKMASKPVPVPIRNALLLCSDKAKDEPDKMVKEDRDEDEVDDYH